MAQPVKKPAAPPAKDPYAGMPPDVAAAMRASDKRNVLGTPAAKKAMTAGTVVNTGAGIQTGGPRAAAAAAATAAIQAANAKETAGLSSALKGGLGGGLRGRATRMNRLMTRIK